MKSCFFFHCNTRQVSYTVHSRNLTKALGMQTFKPRPNCSRLRSNHNLTQLSSVSMATRARFCSRCSWSLTFQVGCVQQKTLESLFTVNRLKDPSRPPPFSVTSKLLIQHDEANSYCLTVSCVPEGMFNYFGQFRSDFSSFRQALNKI